MNEQDKADMIYTIDEAARRMQRARAELVEDTLTREKGVELVQLLTGLAELLRANMPSGPIDQAPPIES